MMFMECNSFTKWAKYVETLKTKGQELKIGEIFALYESWNVETEVFYGVYKVIKPINIKELMKTHKNKYFINEEKVKQYIKNGIIKEIYVERFNFQEL